MTQEAKFKVGTVLYLNGKPLTYGIEQRGERVELAVDFPSRLVDRVRQGELDVGLMSSVACLESEDFCIVGDGAIACSGPAESIKLFSQVQPYAVTRVAVDTSSRTSALLLRIVLEERYYARPDYVEMAPDLDSMLKQADAALLIGDAAMTVRRPDLLELDLGHEWFQLTRLPMVFAVWAARRDADLADLPHLLEQSRDQGVQNLAGIAETSAPELGLSPSACRQYLQKLLPYRLGEEEIAGLREFGKRARGRGLLSSVFDLVFYGK